MDERLDRLLDLLDASGTASTGTSVRLPVALRDASALAIDMGLIASTSDLTVQGLRDALTHVARRAVLDAHYEQYPELRPTLAELALATAQIHSHPLAERPDLIDRAAEELVRITPEASPAEVLAYAAGLAASAA